jgi:diadenosine tetraphosphate (Ap4A) HIT family hydrolase
MHLIPRYEADNNSGVLQWGHREFSDEEFAEICSQMKF